MKCLFLKMNFVVVELIQNTIRWGHRRYSWWSSWGYRTPNSPGILDLLLRKKARNARRRYQAVFRPGDGCRGKESSATTGQRASLSPEIRFIRSGRSNNTCRRDGVQHSYSKPAFCGGTVYLSEGRVTSVALISIVGRVPSRSMGLRGLGFIPAARI